MKNKLGVEDLRNIISKAEFIKMGEKTTICCLTLKNGFEVVGFSACVDKDNYDKDIGEDNAYDTAFEKLWELEGYKLQYDLMK